MHNLADFTRDTDWDVFATFLSEPYGHDDMDPEDWAIDYVAGLLGDGYEKGHDTLINQATDAITRELEQLAVQGSIDNFISGDECPRGRWRIYRSEVFKALCEWCERCDGTGYRFVAGEHYDGSYGSCAWCGGSGHA